MLGCQAVIKEGRSSGRCSLPGFTMSLQEKLLLPLLTAGRGARGDMMIADIAICSGNARGACASACLLQCTAAASAGDGEGEGEGDGGTRFIRVLPKKTKHAARM